MNSRRGKGERLNVKRGLKGDLSLNLNLAT